MLLLACGYANFSTVSMKRDITHRASLLHIFLPLIETWYETIKVVTVVLDALCRKLAFATPKVCVAYLTCSPIMSPWLSYSHLEGASGRDTKLTALLGAGILLLSMVSWDDFQKLKLNFFFFLVQVQILEGGFTFKVRVAYISSTSICCTEDWFHFHCDCNQYYEICLRRDESTGINDESCWDRIKRTPPDHKAEYVPGSSFGNNPNPMVYRGDRWPVSSSDLLLYTCAQVEHSRFFICRLLQFCCSSVSTTLPKGCRIGFVRWFQP